MIFKQWADQDKALGNFRSAIRSEVRRLWLGLSSQFDFTDSMVNIITTNFRTAWNEGAATCGIQPDELSSAETGQRDVLINSQFPFLFGFADFIEENSKENGGRLQTVFDRSELWINRYNEVVNQARVMACADQKGRWIVGQTEHCRSCLGFNGRTYRFSTWAANNALPQTRGLCCRGFNCRCRIDPTTDRITPGKFPSGLLCS